MLQLKPQVKCVADRDTREAHIKNALSRGLPEFDDMVFPYSDIILCGSGPSIETQLEEIRNLGLPIMAINKAHDWLIEHKIIPEYAFTGHPTENMTECFQYRNKAVTYIIASQCHPKLFDWLQGLNVVMSHWLAGENELNVLNNGKLLIGGGITSGVRALVHCYYKGTKKFHVFGFDSSYDGERRNINRYETPHFKSQVEGSKKEFYTEMPLAIQVDQFQDVMCKFKDLDIEVYGEGLLQEMVRQRVSLSARRG